MRTSSREEPDLERSYRVGANVYVRKAVDFKDFVEAVKQVGVFWTIIKRTAAR
jgi:DNA-binding NarL/FixJ family response regulator